MSVKNAGLAAALILFIVLLTQLSGPPPATGPVRTTAAPDATRSDDSGDAGGGGIIDGARAPSPTHIPATFLSGTGASLIIIIASVAGIGFAGVLAILVSRVKVGEDKSSFSAQQVPPEMLNGSSEKLAAEIQGAIAVGADSFLQTEYKYMAMFMGGFSVVIWFFLGAQDGFSGKSTLTATFSTIAFLNGAATSIVCGYLGMKIATYANARTAMEARKGVCQAFLVAFRSGAVMGFVLMSLGLLVLWITIWLFGFRFGEDWEGLYECIAAYGLGGSSIALFGRVGGGIYTKAADVGADLVGKVEAGIPEDDPRNPATIADNVGDNVGDIAGMGADLFGSFAEATCAALVVASVSSLGEEHVGTALAFPLLITALGIFVCLATTVMCTEIFPPVNVSQIESSLKRNLVVSTVIMTPAVMLLARVSLPPSFTGLFEEDPTRVTQSWHVSLSTVVGLWAGLLIGIVTEYYTSNTYTPVCEVRERLKLDPLPRDDQHANESSDETLRERYLEKVNLLHCFHVDRLYGQRGQGMKEFSIVFKHLPL